MKNQLSRRTFLFTTIPAGVVLPFAINILSSTEEKERKKPALQVHVFSKHLQFLDYEEAAATAAQIGFDGVELTVRPNGHVLPENVQRDLPKAVEAVRAAGLLCEMMVTNINEVESDWSKRVLETAADLGIKYYRLGYYRYSEEPNMPEELKSFNRKAKQLAAYSAKLGLKGSYQNHAGHYVGASMWEIWQLLDGVNRQGLGSQYDIRHAVAESGTSWKNGLQLVHPLINTIVIKDFKWTEKNGRWRLENMPLGEGMVDFDAYFKLLKQYGIQVPVSMHYEYPLGGANSGKRTLTMEKPKVIAAMKKDLDWLREAWEKA